ncbi:LytTR family DNA-binding domain-containing protein [Pseudoalteromonas sp. BZB3]|uniref:LytR/AlgR family response regulator transcription factor n=1 Tax=Pseudoalteromonas sp. BZB3 TaxID=3136670 RepID=UPI0032C487B9|tara:strand:+ start:3863 stop:4594 length:732 start_codon:yes stop_codon:yes gene_type:complete
MQPKATIKVLIIDDEPLARAELQRLLKKYKQIEVLGEAQNIIEGKALVDDLAPDAIFLDIEMPGGTGLELAEQLKGEIPIVFCTAYNEFAVDAFSLNAVDYLLKPAAPARLEKAIEKLTSLLSETENTQLEDDFKLMVKFADKMKIILLRDILRFESVGNHAAIYTEFGKSYIHSSLSKIEAKLDPSVYLRASRSEIIRLDAVVHLEESINYGLTATLSNGSEVDISRRQASALKKQMSFAAF